MSVVTTAAAWDGWLGAQAAPISTPVRWKFAPPWPYSGVAPHSYPYILIMPRDQVRQRYSNREVFESGLWRLMYVDVLGVSTTSIDTLMENAATWMQSVITTLQSSETNRSLGGSVDYVGEGEGPPIVLAFDSKQAFLDVDERPGWGIPLDLHVRCLPETG